MERIKDNFLEELMKKLEDICQRGKPNGIEVNIRRMNELKNFTDSTIWDFKILVNEDESITPESKEELNNNFSAEAKTILSGFYKKYFSGPIA